METHKKKKVAQGSALALAGQVVQMIMGVGLSVGLARILGPDEFGRVSLVLAFVQIWDQIFHNGVPLATNKLLSDHYESAKSIIILGLKTQAVISTLGLLILMIMSGCFPQFFFGDASLGHLSVIALIYIFPDSLFDVWNSSLNGLKKFKLRTWSLLQYYSLRFCFVMVFLSIFKTAASAFYAFALSSAIMLMVSYFKRIPLGSEPTKFKLKDVLHLSSSLFLGNILMDMIFRIDRLFLKNILKSDRMVGFYSIGSNLMRLSFMLTLSIASTIFSSIARVYQKGRMDKVVQYIEEGTRYLLLMIVPFSFVVMVLAHDIVHVLYGKSYAIAVPALKILMLSTIFYSVFRLYRRCLVAIDKAWYVVWDSAGLLALDVVLNLVLIPKFGLIGAAWAITLSAITGMLLSVWKLKREVHFSFQWISFAKLLGFSYLFYWLAMHIPWPNFYIRYPAYLMLGVLYIGLMIIMGEINRNDYQVLKSIFKKGESEEA